MCEEDDYRDGALWRHKTTGRMVKVRGTNIDAVWFVYDTDKSGGQAFTTSKPLFEMFYEKVDASEEGLIYLSKV